ncbi:hypothetical protein [Swingsia samuiensis]|uniref:Capsule biosynthesis protein n=1 Tax=Swingsia samuiensis TaxID=1293412 RepID=A0A4Y6UJL4_9PROT|nr:hypothetical protein [Swingsia samuiensis]QDH17000.1 hypothetical protein E3D00_05055 [Swingsia samuiensis]
MPTTFDAKLSRFIKRSNKEIPVDIKNKFQSQKANKFNLSKKTLYTLLIPNLLAISYFGLIATPTFESESIILVKSPQKSSANLKNILSGDNNDDTSGAWIVKNRALSWDQFLSINTKFNLYDVYSNADFISRFGGFKSLFSTSDVSLWNYYKNNTNVSIDEQTGITKISVNSFSPVLSEKISSELLKDVSNHLNHLNDLEGADFVASARTEVADMRKAVALDAANIAAWRTHTNLLAPEKDYAALSEEALALDSKQMDLNSDFQIGHLYESNNPKVASLKARIDILKKNSSHLREVSKSIFSQATNYESLILKQNTDAKLLETAETALQEAVIKSKQNQYYLQTISQPSTPHSPTGPNRLKAILIVLALSLLIRFVIS